MRNMDASSTARMGVLLALLASACQGPSSTTASAAQEAKPSVIVDGWDCADAAACFGLQSGRSHVFERRVGQQLESESWLITEDFEQDGVHVFIQDGGPEQYQLSQRELAFTLRGELLTAMRFPVRIGDRFTVNSAVGQRVVMSIVRADGEHQSPAGSFRHCLLHEARFENTELSEGGMVIETLFCQGVGEVVQSIKVPAAVFPIVFTLQSRDATLVGDASWSGEVRMP